MRNANEYVAPYGNAEEKEIMKASLHHLEEEIQHGDKGDLLAHHFVSHRCAHLSVAQRDFDLADLELSIRRQHKKKT